MKERPIIFSGPMVKAIIEGKKTQTRRVYKIQDAAGVEYGPSMEEDCPYGEKGERLWVREAWADTNGENGPMISYRAGGDRFLVEESYPVDYSKYPGCQFTMWCGDLRRGEDGHSWRSPIHMPRWASRITLEITDVCVQRLQDISEEDALAEGCDGTGPVGYIPAKMKMGNCRYDYRALWDSINGKRAPWESNPWVWAITFRRLNA